MTPKKITNPSQADISEIYSSLLENYKEIQVYLTKYKLESDLKRKGIILLHLTNLWRIQELLLKFYPLIKER